MTAWGGQERMEQDVVISVPPDASPELIRQLAEAFPDAQIELPAPPDIDEGPTIDEALAEVVAAAPGLPQAVLDWWNALPLAGWGALLLILGAIVVGYAGERLVVALLPRVPPGDPEGDFRARLPKGLMFLLRGAVRLGAFVVVGTLAYRAMAPADRELGNLARHVLHILVMTRSFMLIIEALTAPGARWRRLMGFDEDGAVKVRREGLIMIAVVLPAWVVREFVDSAVGAAPSAASLRLVTILVAGLILARFFLRIAEPVRRVLLRRFEDVVAMPGWSAWPARHWAWFYVAAVVIDMMMKAIGVLGLLGPAAARGSGAAISTLMLAPLIIAGLSVWNREAAEQAAEDGRRRGVAVGLFALAEGAVILLAGGLIMRAWGIDPLNPPRGDGIAGIVPGLVQAAVVLVATFALWRALTALLTPPPMPEDGETLRDEDIAARHRIATILPVIRGFALAVLAVMAAMTALSSLGVDIAPLLASAGVLGLAIGFGAQRLVADVISGLLFLYEDAFRVGEYIEVSGGKGAVERISLRSVRLRHPRGPVYTIPFSAMGTVQNHSRDYATMKFTFAVPSDTDVEKVRKLIKKAGASMMEDPEVKDFILEPMKSQGVLSIQGPSYVIGCKFTARPGKQFIVRRKAYVAIQKALEENGIHLFEPQLTVNPADPGGPLVPMTASGQPEAAQPAMVLDRG
jgi:small-conductance mechanosensitive channel